MENNHEGISQLGTQTHIVSVESCNETLRQAQGYSKTLEAFSSQCSDEKIVQFFKCSRRACDFTCEDKESFYCHLLTHNEYEEQDCCIYCERVFVIENLAQHMVSQHGNRRFQCKLCFYRGCTRAHLIIHSLNEHTSSVVQGLACPRMSGALMPDVKPRARTLLYRCSLCSFRAFGRSEFCSHLRDCHPFAQHFCCAYCKHVFDSSEFIDHFKSVHSFEDLSCLYCGATFVDDQEAFLHMVELHSDWPINILDRNSNDVFQTSVDLNHSSPEVEKASEERHFSQAPLQCTQCSTVFGFSESLRMHDCATLSSPTKNTIATQAMTIAATMNSTSKQQTSPPAAAALAPHSKRYSAAPKSVLEKRKKETTGIPSSAVTHTSTEEAPKRSGLSRRKKKSECGTEQPAPPVAQKPVACAVCSVRGFRLEYSTREELALHMLEEHRCIYICNRCFHGEEKFKSLQNHVKVCEGAVERDILTIKNGVLQTSSKVKIEKHQKDRSIARERAEKEKHEPAEYKSYYGRPVEAVDDAVVVVCEDGSRFPMKTFLLLVPQQRLELQRCTWDEMRRWGALD